MIRTDEHWLSVVDAFSAAAIDGDGWDDALVGFAQATGSRAGQLVGFGSSSAARFNLIADPEPGWVDGFVADRGADVDFNPRMQVGLQAPALKLITDRDVVTREGRRRSPFYADLLARFDLPYICATVLARVGGVVIGLAALRSRRQGEIDSHQRTAFASIAPHVRAAVRMQVALEQQGAALVAGAMDALSRPAFVCDRAGVVKAMTPAAEALLHAGGVLQLRHGQLRTRCSVQTSALTNAIGNAAGEMTGPSAPLSSTILIRYESPHPLVLDVFPLPRRAYTFGFEPRVLVVVRAVQPDPAHTAQLLRSAYRLTAAEADVALQLADGCPPEAVAARRGASLSTIRVQIKAIYNKLQVHRQSELAARLRPLR